MIKATALLVGLAPLAAADRESIGDDNVLAYAFNFNRHGARAPRIDNVGIDVSIFADDMVLFPVEFEMLTPSGMRQRYLKGRYNRKRYSSLLSSQYIPGELYVQSTARSRTNQSAGSELLGMYPPGESNERIPLGAARQDAKITSPPFNIRDEAKLMAELGDYALPHGFVPIPIMAVQKHEINGIRSESCPKFHATFDKELWNPDTYSEYSDMVEMLKVPVQAALGLSDEVMAEADFAALQEYAGILTCKQFEGHEMTPWLFTEETWFQLHRLQAIRLAVADGELSDLYMSKLFNHPL